MPIGLRGVRFAAILIGCWVTFCGMPVCQTLAIELPAAGINTVGYAYYRTALPFVDVAHMGNRWYSVTNGVADSQQAIPLNATGYPAALATGEVARSLIFTNNGGIYPTGLYTLRWQGSGDVQLGGEGLSVVSRKAQEITYRVDSTTPSGLWLDITKTDPANPVRNVIARAPMAASASSIFNLSYENDLASYGVIRQMGWNATNNSPISKWSERATPSTFLWGGTAGVPYEYQIQLSNELKEDLWLNVPHMADDNYVQNLAHMVQQNLAPGLRVWVEYSNEVWNPGFQQSAYVNNVLRPQYGVANFAQAYGRRSAEIFDIFSSQIKTPDRLVRVIAGQAGNSWVLNESLKGATIDGKLKADVTAVAPYFTLDIDKLYENYRQGTINLDDVFKELRSGVDTVIQQSADNQKVTAAHGLQMVSYEGGQHLMPHFGDEQNDQGFIDLLAQINRDGRMGSLYTYLLDQWYAAGGKTFIFTGEVYRPDKWGAWGLKETYEDTDSAKFRAVQEYLQQLKLKGTGKSTSYDVWKSLYGNTLLSGTGSADLNGDGRVDAADYVLWRKPGIAGNLVLSLIPEPGTLTIVAIAASINLLSGGRTFRHARAAG
jgi:hypothetical protein